MPTPNASRHVFQSTKPVTKLGIVLGGYVGAVAVATLVTRVYIAATPTVDRQGAGGMSAFGDSFFFLIVLGAAAIPATGAALYFLRSYAGFWRALSVASLAIASTALAAFVVNVLSKLPGAGARMQSAVMISPLRILIAPLLGFFFLLSALFAPPSPSRRWLATAGGIELGSFVAVALMWWWFAR